MAMEKANGSHRLQITVRITGIRIHIPTRPHVPVAAITRRRPTTNTTMSIRSPILTADGADIKGTETTIPKRTARIVCPAVMLAKSRTASESGLANWLTSSIGTMRGISNTGVPAGIRIQRNLIPCITNPTTMLMLYTNNANAAVTTIWLVTVYEPGISPRMLQNRMNTNRVATNGTN